MPFIPPPPIAPFLAQQHGVGPPPTLPQVGWDLLITAAFVAYTILICWLSVDKERPRVAIALVLGPLIIVGLALVLFGC